MEFNEESILIMKASKGDKDAFEDIVKCYGNLIYNQAYQAVCNREDAFDISQEVFIKAYRSIKKFRGECKLSSWLYRICQNSINDFLRKIKRYDSIAIDGDEEGEGKIILPDINEDSLPDLALEKKIQSDTIRNALALLSSEHREIVILRDIQGYTYSEISEILNLEEGTVKSRLNRARIQIKEILIKGNLI